MKWLARTILRFPGKPIAGWTVVGASIACATSALFGQADKAETSVLPSELELESVQIDPSIADMVAKLDDPVFATREAAMQRLMHLVVDRRQICKVLAGDDLSPEQRHRLLVLLQNDVLNAPRGAIGVLIDSRKRRQNLLIVDQLVEGLPAIEVLEPGDEITHLNGQSAPRWTDFVKTIQARKPGDTISLTVERSVGEEDGQEIPSSTQVLHFDLVLGSADLLRDPATGQMQTSSLQGIRAKAARQAAVRFGPQPRMIEFRDTSAAKTDTQTQRGS